MMQKKQNVPIVEAKNWNNSSPLFSPKHQEKVNIFKWLKQGLTLLLIFLFNPPHLKILNPHFSYSLLKAEEFLHLFGSPLLGY